MNIIQTIERANFVATVAMVEALAAAQYVSAAQAEAHNGTYLKVLVVGCQAQVGTKRKGKPSSAAQLTVLEKVNASFYPAVLRGITTPDVAQDDGLEPAERSRRALERNRRSSFARSAKATLALFIRGGGDLRGLEAPTVSKAALRAAVVPPEPEDKTERQVKRAQDAMLRAIDRQARGDPGGARERLEAAIEAMREHLDQLPTAKPATAVVRDRGHTRTRVGGPPTILHRGA